MLYTKLQEGFHSYCDTHNSLPRYGRDADPRQFLELGRKSVRAVVSIHRYVRKCVCVCVIVCVGLSKVCGSECVRVCLCVWTNISENSPLLNCVIFCQFVWNFYILLYKLPCFLIKAEFLKDKIKCLLIQYRNIKKLS